MPKHSPINDDTAYFAQLGRMTIAAGIRHLQPQLNAWLEDKLQTLLADAGVAHNGVDKPRRSTKTLAAAEASLEALTAAEDAAPKRGRPPGVLGSGNYWASKTKEERSEIMRQRMLKRSDPFAKRFLINQPKPNTRSHMIDGRYTKLGAAKLLGLTKATLDRRVRRLPVIRVMDPAITSGKRTPVATYAVADIEALQS